MDFDSSASLPNPPPDLKDTISVARDAGVSRLGNLCVQRERVAKALEDLDRQIAEHHRDIRALDLALSVTG